MVAINSVIDRREVLRIELDREDHELAKITTELDIYRLPITQREEQEADEVGFDFYVTSRFEPKFLGLIFVNLAKARNPKFNCHEITTKLSEPPRYREGISFHRIHPDFCLRYFDLKYA